MRAQNVWHFRSIEWPWEAFTIVKKEKIALEGCEWESIESERVPSTNEERKTQNASMKAVAMKNTTVKAR